MKKPQAPKTMKLTHPIEIGTETVSELTVRRPKAKDFRRLPANPAFGDILDMAAKLCDVPASTIDELDPEDLMPLMDMVGDFLPTSLATGKKR